jgi:5'-3' exonuclease
MGELWPKWKAGKRGRTLAKLGGCGLSFFYMQLITGDSCDNIPGCPGRGSAYAYQLLKDCCTEAQMYSRICATYREKYTASLGESGMVAYTNWRGEKEYKTIEELILEQARLLWMQEYENQMWVPPHER